MAQRKNEKGLHKKTHLQTSTNPHVAPSVLHRLRPRRPAGRRHGGSYDHPPGHSLLERGRSTAPDRPVFVFHGLLRLHDIRQLQGLSHRTHRHLWSANEREQPWVWCGRERYAVFSEWMRGIFDGSASARYAKAILQILVLLFNI